MDWNAKRALGFGDPLAFFYPVSGDNKALGGLTDVLLQRDCEQRGQGRLPDRSSG